MQTLENIHNTVTEAMDEGDHRKPHPCCYTGTTNIGVYATATFKFLSKGKRRTAFWWDCELGWPGVLVILGI